MQLREGHLPRHRGPSSSRTSPGQGLARLHGSWGAAGWPAVPAPRVAQGLSQGHSDLLTTAGPCLSIPPHCFLRVRAKERCLPGSLEITPLEQATAHRKPYAPPQNPGCQAGLSWTSTGGPSLAGGTPSCSKMAQLSARGPPGTAPGESPGAGSATRLHDGSPAHGQQRPCRSRRKGGGAALGGSS